MRMNRPFRGLFWALAAATLAGLTGTASPVIGQVALPRSRTTESERPRVLMLAPREFQQQLKQAERAIAQEQYGEAIDQLGSLLHAPRTSAGGDQSPAQEDYFLGRPGESHYQTSLRSQALRLLGSLPAAGRELYELQFGAEAQRLLNQALLSSDLDGLADLSRKYFHTDAGYKATFLLGRLYLDRGRPLAAAMCFQRLRDTDIAERRYDPELSVLLGVSWQMAGMPDRAVAVLEDLRRRNPNTEFLVRGERVPIFSNAADAGTWLARTFDPPERSSSRIPVEWWMHRGDPTRNAAVEGGLPLLRPRWRVPVSNDPDDEELVQSLMTSHREDESQPLPSGFPLVVGGVALMRTSDNMLAVDFASGKRIWEFPWSEPSNVDGDQDTLVSRQDESARQQLEERLWRDAIYGQLSSDGRSVFLIDDLGYTLQAAFGRRSPDLPWAACREPGSTEGFQRSRRVGCGDPGQVSLASGWRHGRG